MSRLKGLLKRDLRTCRGDILSPIRLLSILWQINLEPKQRRAFDIPSAQQYRRVNRVHDFLAISPFSWPTSTPWLHEWTVQDCGSRHGSAGHRLASHSYCSDTAGGQQESGFIRTHPGHPSSWKQMGFFEKSLGICSHSETQPRRRVIK